MTISSLPKKTVRVAEALDAPSVDLDVAEASYASFLRAFSIDLTREDLRETPRRAAAAMREFLTPVPFELTTFPNDKRYEDPVITAGIRFSSLCEHHVLPFFGRACVAYCPGERLVGLSKLARTVQFVARRLQVQERMTTEIADLLENALAPRGIAVLVEAEHTCMSIRGVRAPGAMTRTSALRGVFRNSEELRREFFEAARS